MAAMVAAAYVLDSPTDIIRAGLAEIPPQSRFHGKGGKRHGLGEEHSHWSLVATYKGDFQHDNRSGKGEIIYANEDVYKGDVLNGRK